jgi:DNA-binding protein H-NS
MKDTEEEKKIKNKIPWSGRGRIPKYLKGLIRPKKGRKGE